MKTKEKTKERGITLVALIITIVVLIILAAVTIFAFTESGLLQTASKGTENYANAQEYEKQIMNDIDEKAKDVVKNITGENGGTGTNPGGEEEPPAPEDPTSNWDLAKINKVQSEDGIIVPVPKGFTMSSVAGEKSVKTGLVIKQDGTANEFVWVPVPEPSEMFTTDPDGNPAGQLYDFGTSSAPKNPPEKIAYSSTDYREPDIIKEYDGIDATTDASYFTAAISKTMTGTEFKEQLQNEFNQMKLSVEKYKGFYIR